ncbi:MAG: hypothetical protein J6Y00_08210, partial [Paludibacteraceae bacterium]|nr:hypothetical protein [Paludibacteraceae bacterium]
KKEQRGRRKEPTSNVGLTDEGPLTKTASHAGQRTKGAGGTNGCRTAEPVSESNSDGMNEANADSQSAQ